MQHSICGSEFLFVLPYPYEFIKDQRRLVSKDDNLFLDRQHCSIEQATHFVFIS